MGENGDSSGVRSVRVQDSGPPYSPTRFLPLIVLIGEMECEPAEMTLELEQKRYETVQKEMEIEMSEASFEELQDQLGELTDAHKKLYTVESRELGSWKELQLLFDPNSSELKPAPLSLQRLEEFIRNREEQIITLVFNDPSSQTLEYLKLSGKICRRRLTRSSWISGVSSST